MVMATFVNGQHKTDYGHIILETDNVLYEPDRIESTPSRVDGINKEDELDIRILACEMIQSAGLLLQLPQVAMATAQILFHRFYIVKSLVIHNYEHLAMASIFLAAKIEEYPRRIRDVINVFYHINQVRQKTTPIQVMDFTGNLYLKQKNDIIKAERRLLKELGFCVHVKYPHKVIIVVMKLLEQSQNTELVQQSWNFMNDALRTDIFLRYTPDQIGCACIFLAARMKKIVLPENPPWYGIFDVKKEQCLDISKSILGLYCRPRPDSTKLQRSINAAREAYETRKSFEKSKREQKNPHLRPESENFSPLPDTSKTSETKKEISPTDFSKSKKADTNGGSDYKNGSKSRKHRPSPRRRYPSLSPERRKRSYDRGHKKKRYSSSESDTSARKRRYKDTTSPSRKGRHVTTSDSDSTSTSTDSEAAKEEARRKKHEEKKKLAEKQRLKETIRQLEREREKKHKIKRDPIKSKHK